MKRIIKTLSGIVISGILAGMMPLTVSATDELPPKWDNSTNENAVYLPEIEQQGYFGSCASWATAYYQFTYTVNKARNIPTTAENTYSPNFVYNLVNGSYDYGSTLFQNYQILKYQGVPTLTDVPVVNEKTSADTWRNWYPEKNIWEHSIQNRIENCIVFMNGDKVVEVDEIKNAKLFPEDVSVDNPKDSYLDTVKSALVNGEILAVATASDLKTKKIKSCHADDDTMNPLGYTVDNGFIGEEVVYARVDNGNGHAMTIVGYNDEIWTDINGNGIVDKGEMGAFKLINSWGKDYANKGFIWLAYDSINKVSSVDGATQFRNRAESIYNVTGITVSSEKNHSSGIFLSYTLNTARRSENRLTVTAKDKTGNVVKEFKVTPYSTENVKEKEKLNFYGKSDYADGTMVFDLNNVVPDITSDTIGNYSWYVTAEDMYEDVKTLTVKDIRIVDSKTGMEYPMDCDGSFRLNGERRTVEIPIALQNRSEISADVITLGKTVTANAKAVGGTGEYTYAFYYKQKVQTKWTTKQNFQENNSVSIKPANATEYDVCIKVKDGSGTIQKRYFDLTVKKALSLNATVSASTIPYGSKFTAEGIASGGIGEYTYAFYYKQKTQSKWTTKQNFQENNSVSIKPAKVTDYDVCVKAKDESGTIVKKYFTVSVFSISN